MGYQPQKALIDLQKFLYNDNLFGPMEQVILADYEQELDEVFGDTNTERND